MTGAKFGCFATLEFGLKSVYTPLPLFVVAKRNGEQQSVKGGHEACIQLGKTHFGVLFFGDASCILSGPAHRPQSPTYAMRCHQSLEFVPDELGHFVLVHKDFEVSRSHTASSIGRVIVRCRSGLFGGAPADPKHRVLERMLRITRRLQFVFSALFLLIRDLSSSMASIEAVWGPLH